MAKGLGLLLVFSCGALLGWGKARALEQRAGELACWQEFLRQFRTVLESTRAAPGEIVRMLARQTAFAGFQGGYSGGARLGFLLAPPRRLWEGENGGRRRAFSSPWGTASG